MCAENIWYNQISRDTVDITHYLFPIARKTARLVVVGAGVLNYTPNGAGHCRMRGKNYDAGVRGQPILF